MQTRHLHTRIRRFPEPFDSFVQIAVRPLPFQETDSEVVHTLRNARLRRLAIPVCRNSPVCMTRRRSVEVFICKLQHGLRLPAERGLPERVGFLRGKQTEKRAENQENNAFH